MLDFELTRRDFLKFSGASLFLAGLPINGYTQDKPPGNITVIILEGGLDGLALAPPVGDPNLTSFRKTLLPDNLLKINSFFGLHPSLKNLSNLIANNNASLVHATSFPYVKRSHFEGQNLIQGGGLSPFSQTSGWLGRALELAKTSASALSLEMPLILRGNSNNDNYFPAKIKNSKKISSDLLTNISAAHNKIDYEIFEKIKQKNTGISKNLPRDTLSLAKYAGKAMSKKDGPVASVIRIGQFDTHATQEDRLSNRLSIVDKVISTYKESLGEAWNRSIILTLTEFGRTVAENGTLGTDHGYASAGIIAGGAISKGGVISDWPGLSKGEQFEGRDLMSTIDYRSVCAACIEKSLGLDHDLIASKVFYSPKLPRIYDELFS
tara:strand:+ start:2350 stop:3489 length:1140 start_codon:yes stop_codon:yes gene_type:complete